MKAGIFALLCASSIGLSAWGQEAPTSQPTGPKGPRSFAPTTMITVLPVLPKDKTDLPEDNIDLPEGKVGLPEGGVKVSTTSVVALPKQNKLSPDLLAGSRGRVNLHALLQAWADTNPTADKFNEDPDATFRIRRAEVRLSGELIPKRVSYVVMTDLARTLFKLDKPVTINNADGTTSTIQGVQGENLLPLRDLYTVLKTKRVDIWLGQFKIPISLEGITSPAQLLLPERSVVSKTFGDKRDLGVKLEKRGEHTYYTVSLYNGAGENRIDTDSTKEAAGRFEYTPRIGKSVKLLLGAAGLASIGPVEQQHKQLIEGDLRVELGRFLIQGEIISSLTRSAADASGAQSKKAALGYYAQGAYTHRRGFQVAGRVGVLDNDTAIAAAADNTQVTELGASINYFFLHDKQKQSALFSEHPEYHEVKLQISFNSYVPTSTEKQTTNEGIIALQSWF
jgi:hypothetical protein